MMWKSHHKGGKAEGISNNYYPNGQRKTESHKINGKIEGLSTQWYENGKIRRVYNHTNDLKHGIEIEWDEDGNIIKESYYSFGAPEGIFRKLFRTFKVSREEKIFEESKHLIAKILTGRNIEG